MPTEKYETVVRPFSPFGDSVVETRYRMSEDMHSHQPESSALNGRIYAMPEGSIVSTGEMQRQEDGPRHLFRYRYIKRALDISLVLLFSPFIVIVFAAIAAAIRFNSPGPIFFSHRRIRRHGAFFSMWKFRTMSVNSTQVLEDYLDAHPEAHAEWRKTHKLRNDPRVTRVGAFLRRTSLDELPQLWNVLTGSMTLVGPRPIVAAEVEKYGRFFSDYCLVKPGLTGLWQVSGRSHTSYPERVQLDRSYAHNWSLLGDINILFKTIASVVNQDGAY